METLSRRKDVLEPAQKLGTREKRSQPYFTKTIKGRTEVNSETNSSPEIFKIDGDGVEPRIAEIKASSKKKKDENWVFRTYLKGSDLSPGKIDRIVHELYKQISSQIDCKTCGNQCGLDSVEENVFRRSFSGFISALD